MAVIPKEFREKFKETTENLTRSQHVNELIKVCKDVKSGHLDKEALREPINRLYDTYDALMAAYNVLLPTQPKTKDLEFKTRVLTNAFESFRTALDEITLYFKAEDPEHIDRGLKILRRETDIIMNIIDDLKQDEDKAEKYTNSPQINELIRIAKGFMAGEYTIDFLKPRFDVVKDIYETSNNTVQEIIKQQPDTKALEEQTPAILKCLELFKNGIDSIEEFFEVVEEDSEKIRDEETLKLLQDGLDDIQKSSNDIYKSQMALQEEMDRLYSPPKVLCPRCSHEVQPGSKFCPECRAVLPKMQMERTSSMDISDQVPQMPSLQEQVMVPPNVKKVYDAAWAVVKGNMKNDEFEKTLDWFVGNIKEHEPKMHELLTPPKNMTPEEEKFFEGVVNTVKEGVSSCLEGIEEMRLYLDDNDKIHLENGLMELMKGGDQLYGIQKLGKKTGQVNEKEGNKK